jgi:ketosteroid isomerase-like protein
MDIQSAAQLWADTWEQSWPRGDAAAIVALYAGEVVFRPAFRQLDFDGLRNYVEQELAAEEDIECRFGAPIVGDGRAAVQWWASWREAGQELTYAGVSVLRFDDDGKVVEQRDYDNHVDRREPPYPGW